MEDILRFMVDGMVFGLSGGLTPGPLMMLVISESLKHGHMAGIRIALAPAISDLPIILISILVVSQMADNSLLIGGITLAGAGFLSYLSWENIRFTGFSGSAEASAPRSLRKGVLANFLNPNPYLFWLTIGAPTVLEARDVHLSAMILFIAALYICLVGSKMVTAVLVGRSRNFLNSRMYIYVIRGLGIVLGGYAVWFLLRALADFGVM